MTDPSTQDLIRIGAAAKRLGVHPITLKRWVASGDFPQPVRLGPRSVRYFRVADVEKHLADSKEHN